MYEAGLVINGIDAAMNIKNYTTRCDVTMGIIGLETEINEPWRVSSNDILAHLADFADNGVIDNPIASIYAWPGLGNSFSEEYNGFPLPENNLNILAQFFDINGDGQYNPDRGDYPAYFVPVCEDGPSDVAIPLPTEMIFFPYALSPNGAEGEADLQVNMTAFRFGCEESDAVINNTLFLGYRMAYLYPERMDDTYVGFFLDGDIGCPIDDYVGLFPDRNTVYFYNADDQDDDCLSTDGFGENPPMVSVDLLRGPLNEVGVELGLSTMMPLTNAAISPTAPLATTDYNTANELRNYLMARRLIFPALGKQGPRSGTEITYRLMNGAALGF